MKTAHYIILLILIQQTVFGQKSLTKDLDGDGINDTVLVDAENGNIICKLSSQNFKEIKSEVIDEESLSIIETKSGFEISVNFMRAGYKNQFRYNKKTKQVQLIGMSRYEFGNAGNEGSGESSINLVTNTYIGNWNYGWDDEKEKMIVMPTIKTKMIFPKTNLETYGSVYSSYQEKCSKLYSKQREKFIQTTIKPEAYNKHLKRVKEDIEYQKIAFISISKTVKYEGRLINGIGWKDKIGEHIIITSETGIYQSPKFSHDDNDGADAELFAYHFIKNGDTYKQKWKVYDYISDCPVDIEANFIKNTLHITDLDKNGVAEVWLMYTKVCHGDVSPSEMKIIMYQGNQKYGMRGENKIQLNKTEYMGGDYKFDKPFLDAPKSFRTFSKTMWNENIEQKWGE